MLKKLKNFSVITTWTLSPSKWAFIVSQCYDGKSLVGTKLKLKREGDATVFEGDHHGMHDCLSQRGNLRDLKTMMLTF